MEGLNRLWVTDVTEHQTRQGELYCCVVRDVFGRRVIGCHGDHGTRLTWRVFTSRACDARLREGRFLAPHEDAEDHGLVAENDSTEDREATTNDSDYEFQLAAGAAGRLVSQSRAHVQQSIERLNARLNSAIDSTPCGIDRALAKRDPARGEAFLYSVSQLEGTSNAVLSHLKGLEVLMKSDTFFPLPAMAITRSIAEIVASVVWAVRPGLSADERTVRSYASLTALTEIPRFCSSKFPTLGRSAA